MNSHHPDQKDLSARCSDTADIKESSNNDKENVCLGQQQHSLLSTYRLPRQRRQTRNPNYYAKGLWSEKEQNQFLTGLMLYGWGQWKEIGTIITTRSNRQIKSHGQKVARKHYDGVNIFEPLMKHHSNNNTEAVAYLTAEMYPPPLVPVKTQSNHSMIQHEKNDSNTVAKILCTMRHRPT